MWNCKICDEKVSKNYFPQHLKKYHQETPEDYTLKFLCDGKTKLCLCGCGKATKYVKKEYKFNDYIHNHHKPTSGIVMSDDTKLKISKKQKTFQASLSFTEKQKRTEKARKSKRSAAVPHIFLGTINRDDSHFRDEIFDFVKDFGVTENDDLDFFISHKNTGVDFNSLYWNSIIHKPKKHHLEKFDSCKKKGIDLLQIFEDEWRDKKDIWKSIISAKLGCSEILRKLNARDLIVDADVSSKILRKFLDENHLQGYAKCNKRFALRTKEGEIVSCLTLRKPFTKNKEGIMEIARLCSKKYVLVRGGFSKLMKYVAAWCREQGIKEILTYSDCRYSSGETYKKYGFTFLGHTGVGYDYTDGANRYFRFKFRAQKPKTEKEVAEENGVFKIYNAGNYAWSYLL